MESTTICLAILFFVIASVYQLYKWMLNYWERKGVYAPSPVFLLGNAKNIILQKWCIGVEFSKIYQHFKEQSLRFGGYYFLFKPIFVPVDLDIIKSIFITDFEHFTNRTMAVQEFDPISKHLFALKGSEWKSMRARLSPAFTTTKNKMLFGTVLKCTDDLMQILDEAFDDNQKVDVNDLASRFSMDVIASCAFGLECNSLKNPNSQIRLTALKFFQLSVYNTVVYVFGLLFPSVLEFFKIKILNEEVTNFFRKLIDETIAYRETNGVVRPDFVNLLLQIRNDEQASNEFKPQLTIDEMTAQSVAFFFAGYETTSITIMYCLYELCKNVEIQNKAREELQNRFLEHKEGEKVSYNLIQNLSYLNQVVYETLRKYPPLPMMMRECTKDYTIPNTKTKIEKGCFVFVPTLGIHRDPELYPNPEVFDPERFSPQALKDRHPCAWAPFGSGPRTCIAYQFGVIEVKTVIACLLHRYKFTINSKTEQPLKINPKGTLLVPGNKIWLNFEKL